MEKVDRIMGSRTHNIFINLVVAYFYWLITNSKFETRSMTSDGKVEGQDRKKTRRKIKQEQGQRQEKGLMQLQGQGQIHTKHRTKTKTRRKGRTQTKTIG